MAVQNDRLQLFDRLWAASSQPVTEVAIPPRAFVEVKLPGPGWYYILEVAVIGGKKVFLDPFWEESTLRIELLSLTGERRVLAVHATNGLHSPRLLERLLASLAKDPEPDCLYRWHVAGSKTSEG